jgi:uncharacterized repeat protein (TIGR02543 family)
VLAAVLLISTCAVAPAYADTPTWTASQAYIDLLKSWEGFSATPYKDNTHYSIGYGTTCPDNMVDYYTKNPITVEQGEEMLKQQLGNFEKAVNNFVYKHGLVLKQNQFDALVSFSYNCGDSWMRELDGYFNVAVREMDMGAALIYGIGLWSTSAGKYILIRRRMREANMFINGEYGVWPDNYRYVMLDGGAGTVSYKICCFDTNLKAPLNVAFKKIPTGVDANGNPFAYTFAGWYTEDGRKVEVLDDSLTNNQTLSARWADPQGNIVTPPAQSAPESAFPKTGTIINVDESVRVRTGPGTDYAQNGSLAKGAKLTVLEEVTGGSYSVKGNSYNTWCKISDNQYVAKYYVQYDDNTITGITLVQNPTVTEYVQPVVSPRLEGSVLLATYANGHSEALTVKKNMISGFDGNKLGSQTVTITYGGKTTQLAVTVRSPIPESITSDVYTVSDGMLLGVAPGTTAQQLLESLNERSYIKIFSAGQELTGDQIVGTDAMVALMDGEEMKAALTVVVKGDVSGDGAVDGRDATLLLQYAAGWEVPVNETAGDVSGDGECDGRDATLLLQYAAGWEVELAK